MLLGQHDLSYRLFFSHVRMVCDLLREMIGEAWVELVERDPEAPDFRGA
jgi:hypothetical protein